MNQLRKNLSLLLSIGGIFVFSVGLLLHESSYPFILIVIGFILLFAGILRLQIRGIRILNRNAKNLLLELRNGKSLENSIFELRTHNVKYLEDIDTRTRSLLQKDKKLQIAEAKQTSVLNATNALASSTEKRTRRILEECSRQDYREITTKTELGVRQLIEREGEHGRDLDIMRSASSQLNHQLGYGFSKLAEVTSELSARLDKLEIASSQAEAARWQSAHRALLGGINVLPSVAGLGGYLNKLQDLVEMREALDEVTQGDVIVTSFSESSVYAAETLTLTDFRFVVICRSVGEQEIAHDLRRILGIQSTVVPLLSAEVPTYLSKHGFNVDRSLSFDPEDRNFVLFSGNHRLENEERNVS